MIFLSRGDAKRHLWRLEMFVTGGQRIMEWNSHPLGLLSDCEDLAVARG